MADRLTPEQAATSAKAYADLTEQIKAYNDALTSTSVTEKQKLELQTKLDEATIAQINLALKLKDNFDKIEQAEAKLLAQKQKIIDANIAEKQTATDTINVINSKLEALQAQILATTDVVEIKKLEAEISEQMLKLNQQLKISNKEQEEGTEDLVEQLTKLAEQKNKINNLDKDQLEKDKKQAETTNDLTKATNSLTQSLEQTFKTSAGVSDSFSDVIKVSLEAGGATGMLSTLFGSLKASITSLFNPVSLLSSALSVALTQYREFFATLSDLALKSGTAVSDAFLSAASTGARFGVSAAEQRSITDNLASSFVNLGNKSSDSTTQLLEASYKLQRLGIDASSSSTLLYGFDRALGMSTESSAEMAMTLTKTAQSLGLTTAAVKELASNMNELIIYGSRTTAVMNDILVASSKFGVASDDIAKLGQSLDSFDKSLQVSVTLARDFNVAIDNIALMRADPAQKLEILAQALNHVNINTDSGRFRLRNLANDLGVSADVMMTLINQTENQSNSMSNFDKSIQSAHDSIREFFGLQTLDGMEQLKIFIENIAKPLMLILGLINTLVGVVFGLINALIALVDKESFIGGFFLRIVILGGLVALAIGKITFSLAGLGNAILGVGSRVVAFGTQISTFIRTLAATSEASTAAIPSLLGVAAAVALIGIGIGAAAFGMSFFVKSFEGFNSNEIYAIATAIVALGAAFFLFGVAMAAMAANPAITTGVFIVLAGMAFFFGVLAASLESVVKNMKELSESVKGSGITDFANALAEIADTDISTNVSTNIKAIYSAISQGDIPTTEKIKALVDISSAVKTYSDATKTFSEGGGTAVATAMNETFVKMISQVTEKTSEMKTTTTTPSGLGETANVSIYLGDELLVSSAFADIVDERIRAIAVLRP